MFSIIKSYNLPGVPYMSGKNKKFDWIHWMGAAVYEKIYIFEKI